MFSLFKKVSHQGGLVGVGVTPDALTVIHLSHGKGRRPQLKLCLSQPCQGPEQQRKALIDIVKKHQLGGLPATCVMEPGSYNLLQLEAPDVEQDELRAAVRWRIKELIDFHIDDAIIDVFDMPPQNLRSQTRMMYVVAARASIVQQRIHLLEEAGLVPKVVDITELAMRNLLSQFPEDVEGCVLLFETGTDGLITLNRQTMLYLARNIDVHLTQAAAAASDEIGMSGPAAESLLLEVQRSMDYYEAHFSQAPIKTMLIAAGAATVTRLSPLIERNLGIKTRQMDIAEIMDLPSNVSKDTLAMSLPLIGATLRTEERSL